MYVSCSVCVAHVVNNSQKFDLYFTPNVDPKSEQKKTDYTLRVDTDRSFSPSRTPNEISGRSKGVDNYSFFDWKKVLRETFRLHDIYRTGCYRRRARIYRTVRRFRGNSYFESARTYFFFRRVFGVSALVVACTVSLDVYIHTRVYFILKRGRWFRCYLLIHRFGYDGERNTGPTTCATLILLRFVNERMRLYGVPRVVLCAVCQTRWYAALFTCPRFSRSCTYTDRCRSRETFFTSPKSTIKRLVRTKR